MPTDADSDTRAEVALGWATLFASTGTLVCCALPIILVTLGLGATVAALTNAVPLLIKISEYKTWVFAGAALLLVLSAWVGNWRGIRTPRPGCTAQKTVRASDSQTSPSADAPAARPPAAYRCIRSSDRPDSLPLPYL